MTSQQNLFVPVESHPFSKVCTSLNYLKPVFLLIYYFHFSTSYYGSVLQLKHKIMSSLLKDTLYSSKFKDMDDEMNQILKYFKHSDIEFYNQIKPLKTPLQAILSSFYISLAEILYNGPTRLHSKETQRKERLVLSSFGTVTIALLNVYRNKLKNILRSGQNFIDLIIKQLEDEMFIERILREACHMLDTLEHNGK